MFGPAVSGQTFLPSKDNKKLTAEQLGKARKKREKREQYFAKYAKEHCLSAFTLSLSVSRFVPGFLLSLSATFTNLCMNSASPRTHHKSYRS